MSVLPVLISDSLMNNNGVLRGNNVIKYVPDQSVVKLQIGGQIRLTQEEFERLACIGIVASSRREASSMVPGVAHPGWPVRLAVPDLTTTVRRW